MSYYSIPGVGTSLKPAAAVAPNGKSVYVAWKGEGNDQGIYWTRTEQLAPAAPKGYTFTPSPQSQISNIFTTHSPALASFQGRVYIAWKGEEGDYGIYWSYCENGVWQTQTKLGTAETENAPAMVATSDAIFLVWKGRSDSNIRWAILGDAVGGDSAFTELGPLTAGGIFFETSHAPSLTADGNTVYMAWIGATNGNLYVARCDEDKSIVYASQTAPGGASAYGNYQWVSQYSIPPYRNDVGSAAIPGDNPGAGIGAGGGAGPTNLGVALVFAKGQRSGLYLAWVAPGLSTTGGPSYPYLYFSFNTQYSGGWAGGVDEVFVPMDTPPALVPVFYGDGQGIFSPIYFFKGLGGDSNIYHASTGIWDSGPGGPLNTVSEGSYPPGAMPWGELSNG